MPQPPRRGCLVAMALACASLTSAPLHAETLEELDALSDLSNDQSAGIAAAQEQAERGEYLEALATLERVLAVHPKAHDALLIHAIYLCKIDDTRGGLVEMGKLRKRDYGEQLFAEARAICERGQGG